MLFVTLLLVAIPITVLWLSPTLPRRPGLAVAVVFAIALGGAEVMAFRATVRALRVPWQVLGVVLCIGVTVCAVVALLVVPGLSIAQYALYLLVFPALAVSNLVSLRKAWRAGWRPQL